MFTAFVLGTLDILTSTVFFQHGLKFSHFTFLERLGHQTGLTISNNPKAGHFHLPNNEGKHLVEDHGFKRLRSLEADKIIEISCHRERPKKAVQLLIKTLSLPPVECRRYPMFSGRAFKDGMTLDMVLYDCVILMVATWSSVDSILCSVKCFFFNSRF